MRKKLACRCAFLLMVAAPGCLWGQKPIWTPVAGTSFCKITDIVNSTPLKIRVAKITACGLSAGSKIWVYGAINQGATSNRSSANIHMENPGDVNNLARTVGRVTGNSFDLYAADGTTPVAPNGTWAYGGLVAKVQQRMTKAGPLIYSDGAGGTVTNGLINGSWYSASRVEQQALFLRTSAITDMAVPHRDFGGSLTVNAALRWYGEGKPGASTSLTNALDGLRKSPMLATAACDTAKIDCGYAPSLYGDYSWELYPAHRAWAYSLMREKLSESERAAFVANALDDKAWPTGGYGYSNSVKAIPGFKPATGTVSWTAGSNAITGTGTAFQSQVNVGDFVLIGGGDAYDRWYPVAAVASNTSLTLGRAVDNDLGNSGGSYKVAVPWAAGEVGWVGIGFNNYYNLLCGADVFSSILVCPDHFQQSGAAVDVWQNHTIGRLTRAMEVGLALAEDDPRAAWLFTDAAMLWYHIIRPHTANLGGITASASGYALQRIWPQVLTPYGMMQFSFQDSPDLTGGNDNMWKAAANYQLSVIRPGTSVNTFQNAGESSYFPAHGSVWHAGATVMLFKPGLAESRELKAAVLAWPAYGDVNLAGSDGSFLPLLYAGVRPDITATPRTNTTMLMTYVSPPEAPVDNIVYFDEPRLGMGSRSGWSGQDMELWFNASSGAGRDHGGREPGPWYAIAANGQLLYGGDGGEGVAAGLGTSPIIVAGGEANARTSEVSKTFVNRQYGSPLAGSLSVDSTSFHTANVTAADRTLIHAKGNGRPGYVLDRVEVRSVVSLPVAVYHHYWIEGCGAPVSTSCVTFNPAAPGGPVVANTRSGASLVTQFFGGTAGTESGLATDGSYPGGRNKTFRVKAEAAGTSVTLFALHRTVNSGPATMPAVERSSTSSHEVFAIADPVAPVVFLSASSSTTNLRSASVTTTVSGLLVADGFTPDNYDVQSNSTPVAECTGLTVTAGQHMLVCPSVPAGAVTISRSRNR